VSATPTRSPARLCGGLLSLGLVLLCLAPVARAELPSQQQLDELRKRLTEPPSCTPECASLPRLRLDVEPERLRIRLELDVAAPSAVPLPGGLEGFVPEQVTVGSDNAPALRRNSRGVLQVALEPGRHQVLMVGPLPELGAITLSLPLAPKQVEIDAKGWTVSGLRGDGRATRSLELVREAEPPTGDPANAEPPSEVVSPTDGRGIPGFVRVTRNLRIGFEWNLMTQVERISSTALPLTVRIPLLPGESVTDRRVEVKEGSAEISFGPGEALARWNSSIPPRDSIPLEAPLDAARVEVWNVSLGSSWHLEASGIPPTQPPRGMDPSQSSWSPWPGEQVELSITRPEGLGGQTVTLDRSALEVRVGARASETQLSLSIRAAKADRYRLALPELAELTQIRCDGRELPLRPVDGVLEIPLRPGAQEIELGWQTPIERGLHYATPSIELGIPSVNGSLTLHVPEDRWVLWIGGPRLGPAVRFWGVLAIAALLAFGLGRLGWTPLGPVAWFLLFVGLTQAPLLSAMWIVAWLLALGLRRTHRPQSPWLFDLAQLGLALLTLMALSFLIEAIRNGLLGSPEMQIGGNDSTGSVLRWYVDRSGSATDSGWVFWVPIWIYRVAMLIWALWIARALLGWLRWGWESVSVPELWRPVRPRLRFWKRSASASPTTPLGEERAP